MAKLSDLGKILNEYSVRESERRVVSPHNALQKNAERRHLDISQLVIIERGVVQDCLPYLRNYRVALEMGSVITCTPLMSSGPGLWGVLDASGYLPGTQVLVLRIPGEAYGYIIGAIPEFISSYGEELSNELVHGSNVGYVRDFQRDLIATGGLLAGGIYAWRGAPLDATAGEFVKISKTGTALFLDPMVAALQASDYCGVWANYLDSLLRVAGLNYQLWTAGSEEFVYTQAGNIWKYKGWGYHVSRQLGVKGTSQAQALWKIPDEVSQNVSSKLSPIEHSSVLFGEQPNISRLPAHDVQEWEGLVGQGGTKIVYQIGRNPIPVSKQTVTAHGRILLSSSRAIVIAKYPFITAPWRVGEPDEQAGDSPNVTTKCAQFLQSASNLPSFVSKVLSTTDYTPLDIYNIVANWEAFAGFLTNPGKFTPITERIISNTVKLRLRWGPRIDAPAFIILDDLGNIVLRNNSGASIELKNGDIRISCPGTIYIDSGTQIKTFSATQNHYAEERINIFASERVQLQVRGAGTTAISPNSKYYSAASQENLYLRLDSSGVHKMTGVFNCDNISTNGIYMQECFYEAAPNIAGAIPSTIALVMPPWYFEGLEMGLQQSNVGRSSSDRSQIPRTSNQSSYLTTPYDVMTVEQLVASAGLMPSLPDSRISISGNCTLVSSSGG
ncbi:MAG TPA: hypothetical protein PKV43_01095 [Armatimonadota bacterium]|nr:hypothetical protein [Armatimonadota bacterium]